MERITEKMVVKKEGAVGWMIFNNPARHNAVSMSMWQAMPTILNDFAKDPAIRVVILAGAGEKAFVSGADISEFEEKRASKEVAAEYNDSADLAGKALRDFPKPTIAMIRGYCFGGGVAIAINCDMRIASDDSVYSVPAAKLGLGYRYEGITRLTDLVGPAFTFEIFYTGRRFSAQEGDRDGPHQPSRPSRAIGSHYDDRVRQYHSKECPAHYRRGQAVRCRVL